MATFLGHAKRGTLVMAYILNMLNFNSTKLIKGGSEKMVRPIL